MKTNTRIKRVKLVGDAWRFWFFAMCYLFARRPACCRASAVCFFWRSFRRPHDRRRRGKANPEGLTRSSVQETGTLHYHRLESVFFFLFRSQGFSSARSLRVRPLVTDSPSEARCPVLPTSPVGLDSVGPLPRGRLDFVRRHAWSLTLTRQNRPS